MKYPWKWAKDATYVICGDVFHKMNLVPPALATRLLRRRSERWLLSGEDASEVLATTPKSEMTILNQTEIEEEAHNE